jgi:hypothetical protein
MDPIRTAVKYSLIPLRAAVALGDLFVESGEPDEPSPPPQARQASAKKRASSAKRQPARKQAAAARKSKDLDDVALARKVESVIFRDAAVPKGKIDVNAANRVVWLRGEAKNPEMIRTLEAKAAAIPEVKQVENLLHLPKTPAPTRTDTPASQRKTRSSTRRPTPTPVERGVTNEGRTAHGEELPVELAEEGEGRQPAPLGSNGSTGE